MCVGGGGAAARFERGVGVEVQQWQGEEPVPNSACVHQSHMMKMPVYTHTLTHDDKACVHPHTHDEDASVHPHTHIMTRPVYIHTHDDKMKMPVYITTSTHSPPPLHTPGAQPCDMATFMRPPQPQPAAARQNFAAPSSSV